MVQEMEVQVGHLFALIIKLQPARWLKSTEGYSLNLLAGAKRLQMMSATNANIDSGLPTDPIIGSLRALDRFGRRTARSPNGLGAERTLTL